MSDLRKFKGSIQVDDKVVLPSESASKALIINSDGEIESSSVSDVELGYLVGVSSSVQDQLDSAQSDATQALSDAADAQADVDDLVSLSGVAANSTDLGTFTGSIISDNTTIKGALQDLESFVEAIPSPFYYAGTWAASTNTPTLDNSDTGVQGAVYYVTDSGSVSFGAGSFSFAAGDKVANNGTTWDKWDMTDSVSSVFGRAGAVTAQSGDYTATQVTNTPAGGISATNVQSAINELDTEKFNSADFSSSFSSAFSAKSTSDLSEGSNLYFTDERAQDAVGGILTDSDTVDFTYDDAGNSITADVKTQMSITSDASGLMLDGDDASPGNSQYYGTNGSGTKGFFDLPTGGSVGDIQETLFLSSNNVSSAADVTGFAFSAIVVRSFSALVSIEINAVSSVYEQFTLQGINKAGSFAMSVDAVGDNSGIVFSITATGQVQYTSSNQTGFISGGIRFRAITTSV